MKGKKECNMGVSMLHKYFLISSLVIAILIVAITYEIKRYYKSQK